MPKVLIAAAYFPPHTGGYEISVYELSRRLVGRGYEVDVLTCNTEGSPTSEVMDGISVYRLPAWDIMKGVYPIPKPSLTTIKILGSLCSVRYDLVQTVTRFFVTSLIGLVIGKLRRSPICHVELGSTHSVLAGKVAEVAARAYDHTLGALVVGSASILMCNSSASAAFLRHLGARKTVKVIPTCGVDVSAFTRRHSDMRDSLGLSEGAVITCISRLIFAKGVQDLIMAFAKIRQEVPSAKLVIVGDGPYRQALEKLAGEMDSENIVFAGQIEHQRVPEMLSITDVLVNPSYSEALTAYPVLEAGAMGIPSVTTDAGGTREIVEDYITGLLVSPGDVDALADRVTLLFRDRDLRERLGASFQRVVKERFDWEVIVQVYCTEVERVLEKQ